MRYISDEGLRFIAKYRNSGRDLSLYYRYILSPLLDRIVLLFPKTLSPNMITLLGLMGPILAHLFTAWTCPDFSCDGTRSPEAPSWIWGFCAFAMVYYQWMDNLDGKQARRTGASSPLGHLFDHGCDVLNTSITAMTVCSASGTGATWMALMIFWLGGITFYMATWEEYHTGGLNLGYINGADEGVVIVAGFFVVTAVHGVGIWHEKFMDTIPYSYLLIGFFLLSAIVTIAVNIQGALAGQHLKAKGGAGRAVMRVLPLVTMVGSSVAWAAFSEAHIFQTHPRLFLWTFGLISSRTVTRLIVGHLAHEEFASFHWSYIPGLLALINTPRILGGWAINEEVFLLCYFAMAVVMHAHAVVHMTREIAHYLGIPILAMPKAPIRKTP